MRNFKLRKAISLVLVIVMVMSLCGITAFAEDTENSTPEIQSGEQGAGIEGQTPDTDEQPAAEESEQPAAEESEQPAAEESEQPAAEESEQPAAEESEQPAADTGEQPAGDTGEQPEESALIEQTINTTSSDNAVITISGMLPDRATVTAVPVDVEIEEGIVLAAYDITIYDADGNVFQPEDYGVSVNVSISNPAIDTADDITIYHMEDANSEPKVIADESVEGNEVSFDADSFSIYVITVTDNGNTGSQTTYTLDMNGSITITYLTSSSRTPVVTNSNPNELVLSDLTSHGMNGRYYKWTINATLIEGKAKVGKTYKFSLKPSNALATDFKVTATTSEKVDHVDIRMADAKYTVTTIFQTADGTEISRSSETVDASVKDVKWVEINGDQNKNKKAQINNGRKEFRFNYSKNKFDMNATIKANIDLLVSGETINVNVTFTDAQKLQAILDCDGYKAGENGDKLFGMDFYITGSQTFTRTEVVTPAEGSATTSLTITKVWADNDNSANARPASLIVNILNDGVATGRSVTLNDGNAWSATVNDLPYSDKYTADEGTITDYTLETQTTAKPLSITNFSRITSCDKLKFNDLNGAFVVIKKGGVNYVWTRNPLSDENAFKAAFVATSGTDPFKQNRNFDATFVSGTSVTVAGGITIDDVNKTLAFSDQSDWSHFGYGYLDANGKNITLTNTYVPATHTVTVTKTFSGVDALPTNFAITYGTSGSLTVANKASGDGSATNPYTWTVSLDTGANVTFTETNCAVNGYALTSAVDGNTGYSKAITVPGNNNLTVAFSNVYAQSFGSDIENPATLTVNKTDGTNALAGAGFTVYSDSTCQTVFSKEQTTNANGQTIFTFSADGTYYLKETTVPSGYTGDSTVWTITVAKSGVINVSGPDSSGVFHKIYNWLVSIAGGDAANSASITVTNSKLYTVTYKNNDGTVLQGPTSVHTGDDITSYSGSTPGKPSDGTNTYAFSEWTLVEGTVGANGKVGTTNLVYQAAYNATAIDYTLTVNYVFSDGLKPSTGFDNYSTGGYHVGDPYTATATSAPAGYIRTDSGNTSGSFGAGNITVTYTYTPNGSATVHVQYFIKNTTTSIREEQIKTDLVGRTYDVSNYKLGEITFEGKVYEYTNNVDASSFTGTYETEGATLKLYYTERTYYAPYGTKVVSGLSELPEDYTATFELRNSSNTVLGTATVTYGDFQTGEDGKPVKDENGNYKALFYFYDTTAPAQLNETSVTLASYKMPLYIPAGTYTVVETTASNVSGKVKNAPVYALRAWVSGEGDEQGSWVTGTNSFIIGENSYEEYDFTVTNAYSTPYVPGPVDPQPPAPTTIPDDGTPLDPAPTTIPDDGTPLDPTPAPSEPVMEIPEEGTPLAGAPVDTSVPQTGDNSNTALLAILATLSALGLGAIGITGKKKKHDK